MSIATEITRLQNAKTAIKTAIEGKGVTVPDATSLDGMAGLIESIEAGGGGDLFHTTITPATSGEVIEITLSDEYKLPVAVVVRLQPTEQLALGLYYPASTLSTVLKGVDGSKSSSSLPKWQQAISYRDGYSAMKDDTSMAWYYRSVPTGEEAYSAFTLYASVTEKYKPIAKFYTVDGTDKKYGLMVGKTYDVWAFF